MKRIAIAIAVMIVLIGGSVYFIHGVTQNAAAQDINQQSIVNSMAIDLKSQGVPIRSIETITDSRWNPSSVVRCVLQSSSTGDRVMPDDVTNSSLIYRVANLARQRGLNIGAVKTTIVNVNGVTILDNVKKVKPVEWLSRIDPPSILDDNTTEALLTGNTAPCGLSIKDIRVVRGDDSLRKAFFDLETPTIQTANYGIVKFMSSIMTEMAALNRSQNTQVSAYQINLRSPSGEVLFIYINDVLLGSQRAWQIDGLTTDWRPHVSDLGQE